jgi:hypothetical protein
MRKNTSKVDDTEVGLGPRYSNLVVERLILDSS